MKADLGFAAEALACQHHDRGDPSDHGDVAEQRGVPVAEARHKIAADAGRSEGGRRTCPGGASCRASMRRLATSALGAELVGGYHAVAALWTKGHLLINIRKRAQRNASCALSFFHAHNRTRPVRYLLVRYASGIRSASPVSRDNRAHDSIETC